jgi:hypothetical protein
VSLAEREASSEAIRLRTARWVDRVVIGLNLCPFAKAVQVKGQVRYAVSLAETTEALLSELERELLALMAAAPSETDTTLLIHPWVLQDFRDANDFFHEANDLLSSLGLEGELQLASFHPNYRFAGSAADDPANSTNRSPYPTLHLLREASVTRAVDSFPEPASIYERNIEILRALDPAELARLLTDDG